MQFPAASLKNEYVLVRAGLTVAEEANTTVTNPVWKMAGSCSLSRAGVRQVYNETLPALKQLKACNDGCWIWPSITQSSYQTAEIMADSFSLGYSRIVPEYSFLDKRGLGALEDLPLDRVEAQVMEGDSQDRLWRPRPNTDGTPHESIADVLVRVRQMMSVTETQFSGQEVVIVSPDSYSLSALQAAVLGVDLSQHMRFAMAPGEVRRLQVAEVAYDASPRRYSCPDPPKCSRMGAAEDPGRVPATPIRLLP
ncbi:hypothetical protein FOA52_009644 [Chlamydomonas sp. UWO 241]|nr:hypothetical protein FOA52_009644 [Chlamydomonas sp. UWO 241]